MTTTRSEQDVRDLYDAVFCYGEEPRCWFNVLFRLGMGWSTKRLLRAIDGLSKSGAAYVRDDGTGSYYARRRALASDEIVFARQALHEEEMYA